MSVEDGRLEAAYEDRHSAPDDGYDPDAESECEHVDTRTEEEAGTGRTFWVCEDCGTYGPA